MSENVIMACGCTSHARRKTADGYIPSCIVHDCTEVAKIQPALDGRTAFCSYGEHAEKPSSPDLPFFKYHGPGSPEATEKCECGYLRSTHWPTWTAHIKTARRWFKHKRYEETKTFSAGLPDREIAELWAAKQVERWLNWSHDEQTRIFEAELVDLTKGPPKQQHEFNACGPADHDEYYCGCHGWD